MYGRQVEQHKNALSTEKYDSAIKKKIKKVDLQNIIYNIFIDSDKSFSVNIFQNLYISSVICT